MEIRDNVLVKVTNEDIVDGTFVIPDYITKIEENAFKYCNPLVEIEVPNNVKIISRGAFSYCDNLKKIKLPDGLNIIAENLFENCISLENVIIPETVEIISDRSFAQCELLKNIILPKRLKTIGELAFYKCTLIEEIIIPDSVTTIGECSFSGCVSLKNIILSNNITKLTENLFSNCSNLENIKLPNNLITIENGVFKNCKFKEINIPKTVTEIGKEAFFNCFLLEAIMIPDKVTEIKAGTFDECKELKKIKLPNNLIKIGSNAFCFCISLSEINIPNSVLEIDEMAFSKCYSLEKVELPINLKKISNRLFYGCENLKDVIISKNVTLIGKSAFSGCVSLTTINLPDSIEEIESRAFNDCFSLQEIIFSDNVKIIDNEALNNCDNLKKIEFKSSFTKFDHNIYHFYLINEYIIYNEKQDTEYINFEFDDDLNKIRIKELLDKIYDKLEENNHIYNLKRQNLDNFYENNKNFNGIISNMLLKFDGIYDYKEDLKKFDILFPNTRFSNLPIPEIFESLDFDLASKYNSKIIKELMKINVFNQTYETKKNIIDVVAVFGLFENDDYVYKRLNVLKDLFKLNLCLNEYDILKISQWWSFFEKITKEEYVLKDNIEIPDEFKEYLNKIMYDYNLFVLKKLDKRIGKKLNDFFKENYTSICKNYYHIIAGIDDETLNQIINSIINSEVKNQITVENLNRIFNNSPKKYNEKALKFIIKYFKLILSNEEYQSKVNEIIKEYEIIEKFYKSKGNNNFNFLDAYEYLIQICFKNINEGNYEFARLVKNAGVTNQEKFEKYQELYETMKKRKKSFIPRINEEILINVGDKDYKINIEILRKDDPFSLLVGESKYTNCCQKLEDAGEACMIHSIGAGRVFCTYLIDDNNNKMLLSESWVWRCGNMICFDNIEGTSIMKSNSIYKDIVAACYKLASERLVTIGKENNDKIEVISIGKGYDDLGLENYFDKQSENDIKPVNYNGYVDSNNVYYVIGDKNNINETIRGNEIYADERQIIFENGLGIKQSTILKLKDIDNKYDDIFNLRELSAYIYMIPKEINIALGEDFAFIYSVNEKQINIHDFIVKKPIFEEESNLQLHEIQNILYEILKLSVLDNISVKDINAEFNNSNAYRLFLELLKEVNIILLEEEKLDEKTYKIRFKVNNLLDKSKKYTK